ncbi:MAG TPA: sugar phosphate isomerase/epimerase family protein [Candidatus Synoicihabitans sp.]|nr:sugar phosphate isomerase/epimerase family protein [Candidatus Synoicihabitans sp.]
MTTRRDFLKTVAGATAMTAIPRLWSQPTTNSAPWFDISLAQWSLHRAFFAKQADPLDFAVIARRDYGLGAVEYVNQFYKDTLNPGTLAELKSRAAGEGVRSVLIMCDGEGRLGDPDDAARARAVENHLKWLDAARELGCHSIRVNAASSGPYEEQQRLAAAGLRALAEAGDQRGLNVIVENHGGLSSNGAWLAGVMKQVDHPRCGTLPDFGNFKISAAESYDRYQGTAELMPFAKGVSAKSYAFDSTGLETTIDYPRMMEIVRNAGYRSFVGIEYEGEGPEPAGIRATKTLLERLGGRAA